MGHTQGPNQVFFDKFLTTTGTKIVMMPLNSPAHPRGVMVVVFSLFLDVFHLELAVRKGFASGMIMLHDHSN